MSVSVRRRNALACPQDFASKWLEAVKGKTRDVVCARIHDESDAVKRGFNALKFVRGEPFKVRERGMHVFLACFTALST